MQHRILRLQEYMYYVDFTVPLLFLRTIVYDILLHYSISEAAQKNPSDVIEFAFDIF